MSLFEQPLRESVRVFVHPDGGCSVERSDSRVAWFQNRRFGLARGRALGVGTLSESLATLQRVFQMFFHTRKFQVTTVFVALAANACAAHGGADPVEERDGEAELRGGRRSDGCRRGALRCLRARQRRFAHLGARAERLVGVGRLAQRVRKAGNCRQSAARRPFGVGAAAAGSARFRFTTTPSWTTSPGCRTCAGFPRSRLATTPSLLRCVASKG